MSEKLNFNEKKKKKKTQATLNKKLVEAVKNGLPDKTEKLLANGANVNLQDRVIIYLYTVLFAC